MYSFLTFDFLTLLIDNRAVLAYHSGMAKRRRLFRRLKKRVRKRARRPARAALKRVGLGSGLKRAAFFRLTPQGRALRPLAKFLGV